MADRWGERNPFALYALDPIVLQLWMAWFAVVREDQEAENSDMMEPEEFAAHLPAIFEGSG